MKWHLDFPIDPIASPAGYQDKILMAGSCFAENIGGYLYRYKFDAVVNPHGILYNPASIAGALNIYLENKKYHADDLFFHHGLWHSWDHHERWSDVDRDTALSNINAAVEKAHHQLMRAEWLIITFGTAGVYRLKESNQIVGNCHKRPSADFSFAMMPPGEIISGWENMISRMIRANPRLKIVFTVSPVRYAKYGLVENNISKSTLLYAVHQLINKYEHAFYFPAYEVVVDELRDYRFYADDLVHPNAQAAQYAWERFTEYFLSGDAKKTLAEIRPVIDAAAHRPLHPDTGEYKEFVRTLQTKISALAKKYPFLNFGKEAAYTNEAV